MFLLMLYLLLALGVSFLCSIMESVILSVTPSFVAAFQKQSSKTSNILYKLKANIDRPLAAILSLNTMAHTIGAAGVGAQALIVFGSAYVAVTSAVLTLLILVLSEIIPKTLGALYWRELAPATARFLQILIWLLYPLVFLSQKLTQLLSSGENITTLSREEVQAIADIGFNEGVFHEQESHILKNLLRLTKLKARDVITPRLVMFTLPADIKVGEVFKEYPEIKFSRIPIHYRNREDIRSYVLQNDILLEMADGNLSKKLCSLEREILVVPEMIPLIHLFEQFLKERESIALVVDEYGVVAGIATMEDIVETLLGIEIVDETDPVVDMQALARQQRARRFRKLRVVSDEKDSESEKPESHL